MENVSKIDPSSSQEENPPKTIPLSDKELDQWSEALDSSTGALHPTVESAFRRLLATAQQFNAQPKLVPSVMTPEEEALKAEIESNPPAPPDDETISNMRAAALLSPVGGYINISRHGLLCLLSAASRYNAYKRAAEEL